MAGSNKGEVVLEWKPEGSNTTKSHKLTKVDLIKGKIVQQCSAITIDDIKPTVKETDLTAAEVTALGGDSAGTLPVQRVLLTQDVTITEDTTDHVFKADTVLTIKADTGNPGKVLLVGNVNDAKVETSAGHIEATTIEGLDGIVGSKPAKKVVGPAVFNAMAVGTTRYFEVVGTNLSIGDVSVDYLPASIIKVTKVNTASADKALVFTSVSNSALTSTVTGDDATIKSAIEAALVAQSETAPCNGYLKEVEYAEAENVYVGRNGLLGNGNFVGKKVTVSYNPENPASGNIFVTVQDSNTKITVLKADVSTALRNLVKKQA